LANEFNDKVWLIDTAATLTTDKVCIRKIRWVPAALNDDIEITNTAGNVLYSITNIEGGGEAYAKELDFGDAGFDSLGVIVTTLVGGVITFYLK
jgi:hypothetical protein